MPMAAVQARLDAALFKQAIAPVFGITRRYVGEERRSERHTLELQSLD